MQLSEETIKQIFFHSDAPRKDAMLADEVDIVQFAEKIADYVTREAMLKERSECIKFVRSLNSTVADALEANRPLILSR